MKVIGLIGGMSWESSAEYYRILNQEVRRRCGGLHSARSLLYSVDFAEIERLQHLDQWDAAADVLRDAAQRLERGGADIVVLCTNTMHKVADEIQAGITIPLLHIADATADAIQSHGLRTVGLLGTRFTMEETFYIGRLRDQHGLDVRVPSPEDRETIHRIIYDELCVGVIESGSKARYLTIIERMVQDGSEGIILGCTEIGLLIHAHDCTVPLFDTTQIHATAAVARALG